MLGHGIGGPEDLPLPLGWVLLGSAAALVISFGALGLLWREPRLRGAAAGRPLPFALTRALDGAALRSAAAGFGLLLTGWTLLALFFGADNALNPSAHLVYVLGWVGLVPASVLLGPLWRQLNPLRRLHSGISRLARLDPAQGVLPLPVRLGWWPAAAGILAFSWLELVYPEPTSLLTLRLALGLFAAGQLLGALAYGSGWFDRADPLEAWSTLFGRFSLLGRRDDGVLVLRSPLDGLAGLPVAPGLVATVVVMLGSTSYDGVSAWPGWVRLEQSAPLPRPLIGTLGLLGTIAAVGGLYLGATWLAGRLGGRLGGGGRDNGGDELDPAAMPAEFAHTLLPVALGYLVAHYYSLLAYQGPRGIALLSDPLGIGANWLGSGGLVPNPALISPGLVTDVQVLAIVAGHLCGVILAHDRAVRLFDRRTALIGQLPLLLLMMTLTSVGLLLLFGG